MIVHGHGKTKSMKCWLISDTHNRHLELQVPVGVDVVIHCGDESSSRKELINETESRIFFNWFSALDIPEKIFVPGNHSVAIERGLVRPEHYPTVQFLIHQKTNVHGLVVFGSPYTPEFFLWAYMRAREDLNAIWQSIPSDVDILVTHGPPKGILDVTRDRATQDPIHVGSKSLTRHVTERIQPMVHAFGHIHDEPGIQNFGMVQSSDTLFVNCSCCITRSKLVNHGIVLDIDPATKRVAPATV